MKHYLAIEQPLRHSQRHQEVSCQISKHPEKVYFFEKNNWNLEYLSHMTYIMTSNHRNKNYYKYYYYVIFSKISKTVFIRTPKLIYTEFYLLYLYNNEYTDLKFQVNPSNTFQLLQRQTYGA